MFNWYKKHVESAKSAPKPRKLYYVVFDNRGGKIEKIDHTYSWAYSPKQAFRNIMRRLTKSDVSQKDREAAKKVEQIYNYFPDYIYCVEEKNPPIKQELPNNELPDDFENSEIDPDEEVWGDTDEDTPPITKDHSTSWYNK